MQQMRVSVTQKCFQFVLESVQRGVRRPQIVWQTVPHSWSMDREAAVTVACPRLCLSCSVSSSQRKHNKSHKNNGNI